jgi:hypothetical protein
MLEPQRPGAASPDRALCLPTFSHFVIFNKTSLPHTHSLSLALALALNPDTALIAGLPPIQDCVHEREREFIGIDFHDLYNCRSRVKFSLCPPTVALRVHVVHCVCFEYTLLLGQTRDFVFGICSRWPSLSTARPSVSTHLWRRLQIRSQASPRCS